MIRKGLDVAAERIARLARDFRDFSYDRLFTLIFALQRALHHPSRRDLGPPAPRACRLSP